MTAMVKVFSELPMPLNGIAYGEPDKDTKKRQQVGEYKLLPGMNYVDEDVWKVAREIPQIKKRLETGRLKEDHKPTPSDMSRLRGTADRSFIQELSKKAGAIPNEDPIFGVGGQPDRTIANLEAQIKKLNAMVEKLSQDKQE